MVTCVRSLPDICGLVSGETIKDVAAGGAFKELLRYYDINAVCQQKGGVTEPLHSFAGHTGLVTCVAPLNGQPHGFLSGRRLGRELDTWGVQYERRRRCLALWQGLTEMPEARVAVAVSYH
jgi:hypothetical protein